MRAAQTLYNSTSRYFLGHYGCLFIVYWQNETPVEGVHRMVAEGRKLIRQYPKGIGVLTVVGESPLPEPEARKGIADFMSDNAPSVRAAAVVFEGVGFRQAAIRGVVTALNLMAKQKFPQQAFGNVGDATTFLYDHLRTGLPMGTSPQILLDATQRILRESRG